MSIPARREALEAERAELEAEIKAYESLCAELEVVKLERKYREQRINLLANAIHDAEVLEQRLRGAQARWARLVSDVVCGVRRGL